MRKLVERAMDCWGRDMVIVRGDREAAVRGFLCPVNSSSWQRSEEAMTPLGMVSRGQYHYIGPPGQVCAGDVLVADGKAYVFLRAEDYDCGSGALYQWGLCTGKGGEDTWGSGS